MVNETAIADAIAELEAQIAPNYRAIAKKHEIDHKTLLRRYKGQNCSYQMAHLENQGLLTIAQEAILVQHINTLSNRGLPPTPQFVKNLVFEMVKSEPGKIGSTNFANVT
jgi:hypothetical protein